MVVNSGVYAIIGHILIFFILSIIHLILQTLLENTCLNGLSWDIRQGTAAPPLCAVRVPFLILAGPQLKSRQVTPTSAQRLQFVYHPMLPCDGEIRYLQCSRWPYLPQLILRETLCRFHVDGTWSRHGANVCNAKCAPGQETANDWVVFEIVLGSSSRVRISPHVGR